MYPANICKNCLSGYKPRQEAERDQVLTCAMAHGLTMRKAEFGESSVDRVKVRFVEN